MVLGSRVAGCPALHSALACLALGQRAGCSGVIIGTGRDRDGHNERGENVELLLRDMVAAAWTALLIAGMGQCLERGGVRTYVAQDRVAVGQ